MKQIGVAIIGTGNMAQTMYLPTLAKLPHTSLVAVCDRNKTKSKFVAEKYGIAHTVKDVAGIATIEGIDAVFITTSTDAHYETALACLEMGKDVMIEKPIARTYHEAEQINTKAHSTQRKLMVAMNHRFRADTMLLKNYLDRDELGNVTYLKAGWLKQRSGEQRWLAQADVSGGGVTLDLGIVLLDLMLWFLGYPQVHSVRAVMQHHQTKKVEDFLSAMIHFANNTVATLEVGWSLMRPEDELYYCNVFGSKGSAYINPLKLVKRVNNEFHTIEDMPVRNRTTLQQKSYHNEISHFLNAVRDIVPIVSTGDEAVAHMRLIEALYTSAREREEVRLDL